MMLLANVIFPRPSAAYFASYFLPLAVVLALGTEFLVFYRTQRGLISAGRLLLVVAVLNIFSWLGGLLFSLLLPAGLVPPFPSGGTFMDWKSYWSTVAIISFPLACVASTALEYLGLRLFYRRLPFRSPLRTVCVANAASYAVLAVMAYVLLRFFLH